MKQYECKKCGSKNVYMEIVGVNTGLYCYNCGKWIKWLGVDEVRLVENYINEYNNSINTLSEPAENNSMKSNAIRMTNREKLILSINESLQNAPEPILLSVLSLVNYIELSFSNCKAKK